MLFRSKRLLHWEGIGTVATDSNAVSGRAVSVGAIKQEVTLINNEQYVLSFKAKGTDLAIALGTTVQPIDVSADWYRYVIKFTADNTDCVQLAGTAMVCDIKLERGTIDTDWCPARQDANEVADKFKHLQYLQDAMKGNAEVIGALMLISTILLGQYKDGAMDKEIGRAHV